METDAPHEPRLLIAVDDSDAAARAVGYVARVVGARPGMGLVLYHRMPPLPPELRDHGGSEHPEREIEIEQAQGRRIADWMRGQEAQMRPVLEGHRDALTDAGVPATSIDFILDEAVGPREDLSGALRRAAQAHGCDTIVLAREHVSGMQEWLTRHISDELARHPEGFAIWIVD